VTTPPGSGIDHDAPDSPESRLVGWDDPGQGCGDIKAHLDDPNAPYPALVATGVSASTISWGSPGDAPGFIAHGELDTTVPHQQSVKLHAHLQATGVVSSLTLVPNAGHGSLGAATNSAAQAFLVAELMPQEAVYLPALSTFQPKPALGATITLNVVGQPGATLWQVFRGAPAASPFALPGVGAVLLDLGQPIVKLAQGGFPLGNPIAQPGLPIPVDPALHGTTHVLQAVVLAGALARVTNGLTVFVQ
jgi:hypothetical protein